MATRLAAIVPSRPKGVLAVVAWLSRWWADLLRRRRLERQRAATLRNLSSAQKALLRQYLERNTRTLHLPRAGGVAMSLEHADVVFISRETQPTTGEPVYALAIYPWAWERLSRDPELLRTALAPPLPAPAGPR